MKNKMRAPHDGSVEIRQIAEGKTRFLRLLLIGDEEEAMIDRYLERGTLFALYDSGALIGVAVVTAEADGQYELKNIAVAPAAQRMGYGKMLLTFLCERYKGNTLLVGTGDSPLTIPFYEACGFRFSHRIPHFFQTHYSHPIYEGDVLLDDMVYLKKEC